jgi:hypothetical protein
MCGMAMFRCREVSKSIELEDIEEISRSAPSLAATRKKRSIRAPPTEKFSCAAPHKFHDSSEEMKGPPALGVSKVARLERAFLTLALSYRKLLSQALA